jgi:hypothetical protein
MATYTVKIPRWDTAMVHFQVDLYKDSSKIKTLIFDRSNLFTKELDVESLLIVLLRSVIKSSGATTAAQAKAAVEAAEWEL